MRTEILNITGMTCGGCVDTVAKALKATAGVKDASVDLASGRATVQVDENTTSEKQLAAAVQHAGYGVGDPSSRSAPARCCCGT